MTAFQPRDVLRASHLNELFTRLAALDGAVPFSTVLAGPTVNQPDGKPGFRRLSGQDVTYRASGAGVFTTDVQNRLGQSRTLLDFIPVAQHAGIRARTSTTDVSSYLQAAIDQLSADGGGDLYVPAGRYWLSASSAAVQLKSNVRIVGAGMGVSVFRFDDTAGSNHGFTQPSVALDNATLQDLTIQASGDLSRAETGLRPVSLDGSAISMGNIRFLRVEIADSRAISLYCVKAQRVEVDGCRINRSARDGIAVWRTPYVTITNNMVNGSGDDGISVHSVDSDAAPVRGNIIVAGNHLTQCQGIVCLGAKRASIANNVLFLCYARGIRVSRGNFSGSPSATTQGTTASVAVAITDNVICDLIQRPETNPPNTGNWYMRVGGGPWGVGADTAAPGRPRANGTLVDLYGTTTGNLYLNDTDLSGTGSTASPGGQGVTIRGNILLRTLPAVSACTDWGYGALFVGASASATGGYWSGAVTEAQLASDGLWLMPAFTDAVVSDNLIRTTGQYAINFNTSETDANTAVSVPALTFDRVQIRDNVLADFTGAGIRWNSSNTSHQRISVRGNLIDGDPRFKDANRTLAGSPLAPNGTWINASAGCLGMFLTGAAGWDIQGNIFRNVRNHVAQASTAGLTIRDNAVCGLPAAVSFSASNVGVGTMPRGSDGWTLIAEDGNPSSATFGQVFNTASGSSSAMPTTGYWLAGTLVPVDAPTAGGSLGWMRLTTGSANVAGTDWVELRAQHGDPVRSFAATASPAWQAGKNHWRITGGDGITMALPDPGWAETLTITINYAATSGITIPNSATCKLVGGVNATLTTLYSSITLKRDTSLNAWIEISRSFK